MSATFGSYARARRERLHERFPREYSVRRLAKTIGVQPSYVSKIEREEVAPPSEETIIRWASALEEDPDVMLALAGKVSHDLREAIIKRPQLFAELIRELKDLPDTAVLRLAREVRDGNW